MQNEKTTKQKEIKKRMGIAKILDGSFLMDEWVKKQIPFIGLLVFLSLIYITSRISAEKKHREINNLKKDITSLIAIESELNTEVSELTKPTVIANRLRERGLKESISPKIILKR